MPFCYSTFTSTRVMNHEQPDPTGAEQTSLRFHLHVRRSLVFISASRKDDDDEDDEDDEDVYFRLKEF
ncbi:hypothetical protein F2P81_017653 [Scophthalmus maximus]|uniref:Uncharacterized protein n=1 Tax=Scophthalmus maximus TaxID=52904 RepID=A0A6A4SKN9_SCOMX|nr:hypothetical protein F2P81_017653 [Scophthalmus maximus]